MGRSGNSSNKDPNSRESSVIIRAHLFDLLKINSLSIYGVCSIIIPIRAGPTVRLILGLKM